MNSPISNNNPSLVNANRSPRAEEKAQNSPKGREDQEAGAAPRAQDDSVSVSRAAQVLSEQPSDRGAGRIETPEQAAQVAKGLKALFSENSGKALAAQAKTVSPDMMELLKTG